MIKKLLLIILLLYSSSKGYGQLGIQLSSAQPFGNYADYYNNTTSYELYYHLLHGKKKVTPKIGIFYSNYTPRTDTLRVFVVDEDYHTGVHPGTVEYSDIRMIGLVFNVDFKLFHIGKLSAFAGIGIDISYVTDEFRYQLYKMEGVDNRQPFAGGIRTNLNLEYQVNQHLFIYAEGRKTFKKLADIVGGNEVFGSVINRSSNYSHNNFGIGIIFIIHPTEDDQTYNYY